MATVTKAVLKTYFEQGDIPTQGQYVDLIDSQFGLGEAGTTQIIQGTISASAAEIEFMSFKKLYLPGLGVKDMKVGTTFIVGQTLEVSGSLNVEEGNIITNQNITASGNIEADKYHSNGRNLLRYKTNQSCSVIGNKFEDTQITGSTIQLGGKLVNGTSTVTDCHVTASANFSASGVITGNGLTVTSNSSLTGSLIVRGNTTLGTDVATIHTIHGNITASNHVDIEGSCVIGGGLQIDKGLSLSHLIFTSTSVTWASGLNIIQTERKFTLKFTGLPILDSGGKRYSNQSMHISNSKITASSIVLINHSTIYNSAGTYIGMKVSNVRNGLCTIIPYSFAPSPSSIPAGGEASYNVIIL